MGPEALTHVAAAGHHGELRCARCGIMLYRNASTIEFDWSEKAFAHRAALKLAEPKDDHYPYRAGDTIVRGPDWQAMSLSATAARLPPFCKEKMDKTYRFGRLVLEFPKTTNYHVEIRVDGQLETESYRPAMKRGVVGPATLTDAEIMWLLGFDDEVAEHDAQWEAAVNR